MKSITNSMNTQDSQSELEGLVADIIGDARSIDVGFVADETSKYQAALNEGVKTIEAYVTTRVKEAERLARIEENNYHWHRQKRIEKEAKTGVSGYFLDRIDELKYLTATTNGRGE